MYYWSQALMVHTCSRSYLEAEIRRTEVQGQPGQKLRPYLKNTHHTHKKKGLAVVEPNKCEALSSNPSTK
jgi:hypothetical protein